MARLEGLNRRGDRWYLRIVIPQDLQPTYGNKARINRSLGTSDRGEALKHGHALRGEWLADFETTRRAINPEPLPSVSPELASMLAERVRYQVLGGDDTLRHRLATGHHSLPTALSIPAPVIVTTGDPMGGMGHGALDFLSKMHGVAESQAAIDLATLNLRSVLPVVKAEALALGLVFDETAPGAREALLMCLKAWREAVRDLTKRDEGEVIDTPPKPAQEPPAAPAQDNSTRTLRDVFDRWKESGEKPRSYDSSQSTDRALRQFETQHPGLPLKAITKDLGDSYRAWLRDNSRTPKTARDRLNALKSLLKYAAETLEWMPKHPWRGLNLRATITNKRRP